MKEFLSGNFITIFLVVALLTYIIILTIKGKWEQLRAFAYEMMLKTESIIVGTKRGQERFEVVFKKVYNLIPPWLQFFVTESDLREQIQEWYNNIKDYMDDSKINGSTAINK